MIRPVFHAIMSHKSIIILGALVYGFAAQAQEIPKLEVQVIKLNINGAEIPYEKEVDETLIEDVPKDLVLYQNDKQRFVVTFEYARSGKRIKLIRRSAVRIEGAKPIQGKQKKDVDFIKVSIPGKIENTSSDHILIDKDNFESIFLSFRYQFTYQ